MSKTHRGSLTIHPPLNRAEIARWERDRPPFGYKMVLVTEDEVTETDTATITTTRGVRLRTNHHWDIVDTLSDMRAFADMFPERRIGGEILFETEKVGVVGRLVIRNGKAEEQHATLVWPED